MQSSLKVLAIDDDPKLLQILGYRMQLLGYQLETAESGMEGMAKAEEFQPDIIILDLSMPEMDGFEIASHLKSNESTRNIPILMLTGHAEVDNVSKAFECGIEDFVVKPYDPFTLQKKIEQVVAAV